MAILVGIIGGGVFEFGPEHDDERLRWEIGKHGQLAIIKQVHNAGMGRTGWTDEAVIRVFNGRVWSDIEIVE